MKNFLLHDHRIKAGDDYFDSVAELKRYNDLRDLQDSGAISELQHKVRFVLIPDQPERETRTENGVQIPGSRIAEKGLVLKADFSYKTKNGHLVAEVRKGSCGSDFGIKKSLMLCKYKAVVKQW